MTTSEMATVLAWHDALNARDIDTLLSLSSDDIEIGGAHGAAQGHPALAEWARGVQGSVEPGRIYVNDGVVVVEEISPDAQVTSGASGAQVTSGASGAQVTSGPSGAAGAAAFRVVDDHVTSVFRHDDLAAALAATDLTEADLTG